MYCNRFSTSCLLPRRPPGPGCPGMSLSQSMASTRLSETSHSSSQLSGMLRQNTGNEIDRENHLLLGQSHDQRVVRMVTPDVDQLKCRAAQRDGVLTVDDLIRHDDVWWL